MMLLQEIFRIKKAELSDGVNLRIQRGLSWLKQANALEHDLDFQFISLWISFNALHAQSTQHDLEQNHIRDFLQKILAEDVDRKITHIVLTSHAQQIRKILDHAYLYQVYWDYQHQKIDLNSYKQRYLQEKLKTDLVLEQQQVFEILIFVFERLYGLYQRVIAGGMTCQSSIHRLQFEDSCVLMNKLIPQFILILMEHPHQMTPNIPFYPMVQVS